MHLDSTQATLIGDCLELMQGIKEVLLRLQQTPADTAIASAIPSTAQAIKSMADMYGCKHVAAFLFVFEAVLNGLRDAELRPKADLIALLVICCDHVSRMASHLAHRDEIYLGDLKRSHGLIRQLHAYLGNKDGHAAAT